MREARWGAVHTTGNCRMGVTEPTNTVLTQPIAPSLVSTWSQMPRLSRPTNFRGEPVSTVVTARESADGEQRMETRSMAIV